MAHPLAFPASCLTVLVLAAGAAAQQFVPVTYPQERTAGSWSIPGPLGQDSANTYNEGRAQMLIPQAYLPSTGGLITGIDVVIGSGYANYSATVTYQILDINLGVTAAHSLSPTFATNLPTPTAVLSLRPPNSTITYTPNAWTPLTFTVPYPYSGTGNLILEFRKSVMPGTVTTQMRVPSDPRRFDLPQQVHAMGAHGSGAINATTAPPPGGNIMPLRMRLWFQGGRSMTVLSPASGYYGFEFALGSTVTMTVHGAAGDLYWSLVDFQGLGFVNPPWPLPGLQGLCYLNVSPWLLVAGQGVIPPAGNVGVSPFPLPNNPYFVGRKLVFQSVAGTPTTGWSWTPATDAIVSW